MRVDKRLVLGNLWYTSLPVYEWRVYTGRNTFHEKFMSGSWTGYEWTILGAPDSWNHTRHWYCIFLGTWPSLLATKTKVSWASHEKIMRGSWVGAPVIPKELQNPFRIYHYSFESLRIRQTILCLSQHAWICWTKHPNRVSSSFVFGLS